MTRPLTALKTGEVARVDLKGRNRTGIFAFAGMVAKVDDHPIRLEPVLAMCSIGGSLPSSTAPQALTAAEPASEATAEWTRRQQPPCHVPRLEPEAKEAPWRPRVASSSKATASMETQPLGVTTW